MKNPFEPFKGYGKREVEIPLDRIVPARQKVMKKLLEGYEAILSQGRKDFIWLVEHDTVQRAYVAAQKAIEGLDCDAVDIEEFCYSLEGLDHLTEGAMGPMGVYVSALCNQLQDREICLRLSELGTIIHLMGYRLPEGKVLMIEGDLGDFTGLKLDGGELTVRGSTRDWTGAGMKSGKITVEKNAGRHTGEWMIGGEIHIGQSISEMGEAIYGRIYERERLVFPKEKS